MSTTDQLAELQVRRKFYIGLTNKQTNACGALVRRSLGWRYDMGAPERTKLNAAAAKAVAAALAGKGALNPDLEVVRSALAPLANARHQVELEMKKLARGLPVYAWAKSVHGFGELGLAVIVAEAGDLSGYPTKGHLWKRFGLAPHAGQAYSSWRRGGGLDADQWDEAGYAPRRLAQLFGVVTEPLLRAQTVKSGPYRAVYDRRRAAALLSHPDWTKAHAHADGLRVMTKALLRNLWKANRWAILALPERVIRHVPTGRRTEVPLPARAQRLVSAGASLAVND